MGASAEISLPTTKIKKDLGLQEPVNGLNQLPETKQERDNDKKN